jgi:hypothetical protein
VSARGTVYLTDGFERLDLPGKTTTFALTDDWQIEGREIAWEWPHDSPGTVAGAIIVKSDGETKPAEGVGPVIVRRGERVEATARIKLAEWQAVET